MAVKDYPYIPKTQESLLFYKFAGFFALGIFSGLVIVIKNLSAQFQPISIILGLVAFFPATLQTLNMVMEINERTMDSLVLEERWRDKFWTFNILISIILLLMFADLFFNKIIPLVPLIISVVLGYRIVESWRSIYAMPPVTRKEQILYLLNLGVFIVIVFAFILVPTYLARFVHLPELIEAYLGLVLIWIITRIGIFIFEKYSDED